MSEEQPSEETPCLGCATLTRNLALSQKRMRHWQFSYVILAGMLFVVLSVWTCVEITQ